MQDFSIYVPLMIIGQWSILSTWLIIEEPAEWWFSWNISLHWYKKFFGANIIIECNMLLNINSQDIYRATQVCVLALETE